MSARESWKASYRELIEAIVHMGYPEEFGKAIAKKEAEAANARYNEILNEGLE